MFILVLELPLTNCTKSTNEEFVWLFWNKVYSNFKSTKLFVEWASQRPQLLDPLRPIRRIFFKKRANPGLFFVFIFGLFKQTIQLSYKSMQKNVMSIQYMAQGIEPTTS